MHMLNWRFDRLTYDGILDPGNIIDICVTISIILFEDRVIVYYDHHCYCFIIIVILQPVERRRRRRDCPARRSCCAPKTRWTASTERYGGGSGLECSLELLSIS